MVEPRPISTGLVLALTNEIKKAKRRIVAYLSQSGISMRTKFSVSEL